MPEGLTVTAYATDLANPRTVHTLPNGDVLVVQCRGPCGQAAGAAEGYHPGLDHVAGARRRGEPKESNLITLLRDTDRDGTVDERSDLLTELNSPFGVAWYDDTLYVAATDAVLAYPYELGQTSRDHGAPDSADAAAGRADQPPLDQGPGGQPRRPLPLRLGRLQLQHRRERP